MKKFSSISFYYLYTVICLLSLLTVNANGQWVQTNGPFGANVWSVLQSGTTLFAGTYGQGVFRSVDDGANWTSANNGLSGTAIYALTANGSTLYAGTDKGIGVSTDDGITWKSSLTSKTVQSVLINSGNTFIGTSAGIYISGDGIQWKAINTGLTNKNVSTMIAIGQTLFAGTLDGIFSSTNNGAMWTQLAPVLINRLAFFGTNLYAATNGGVFVSPDSGSSWSVINAGDITDNTVVWDFAMIGSNLFAATDANGILSSSDNGSTWISRNTGLQSLGVSTLRVYGNHFFAGTVRGVSVSTDNGISWTDHNAGLLGVSGHAFAVKGNDLYAASQDHLYKTSDNGRNWSPLTDDGGQYSFINALLFHGNDLFVADAGNGVFRSGDNGITWEAANSGLVTNKVWCLGQMGDVLLVGSYIDYIYSSFDNGANWQSASSGISGNGVSYFVNIGDNLFAESGNGGSFGTGGVFLSKDTGATWTSVSTGLPVSNYGFSLAAIGTKLYASASGFGVFISADSGSSWKNVTNGLSNIVGMIYAYGTNLLASTDAGIFLSKDGSASWIDANAGLPTTANNIWSMVRSGTDILIAGDQGFFRRPIAEFDNLSGVSSENTATKDIFISPNPTNGMVTVGNLEQDNVRVTVTNIIGQHMMEFTHHPLSSLDIDLTNFPSGTYLATFVSASSVTTKIIEKN